MKTQYYKDYEYSKSTENMQRSHIIVNERNIIIGFVYEVYDDSVDIVLWEPMELDDINKESISESLDINLVKNKLIESIISNPIMFSQWDYYMTNPLDNKYEI